ncbi:Pterin-4a-carbinolamine dehydratase [Sulfurivirga caldicuralii]|uniref:4a-hydroxytetrahydrobiopterin dehydratase n=1 Tax=Sulfurivirga caldicuralii TaxID=364032 RepID=A0A1N6DKC6_9GAMM|nr:4a-hydroxytetrahydrobiopterin dehydratase [Sulfurivirga caldicuralii]SIN71218.1 Pterin-4a-carbinolamine dehydratase [Sulfurivirga caldicuralii]
MNKRWKERSNGRSLETRYLFENFECLREFLDCLADITEALGRHPNISFDRSHVSIIIYPNNADGLDDLDYSMADQLDEAYDTVSRECIAEK